VATNGFRRFGIGPRKTDNRHLALESAHEAFDQHTVLQAGANAGNSAAWLLAHIISSRQVPLLITGAKPLWDGPRLQRWGRDATPLGDHETLDLDQLRSDLHASQQALMARLSSLTEDDLAKPTPMGTVGGVLAFLSTHEAHHTGQLVTLRRSLGLA
jgi:DinB superfamily